MSDKQSPVGIGEIFRNPIQALRELPTTVWNFAKAAKPIYLAYLALFFLTGSAVWEARTPVTMIAPFQVPNDKLPFTGAIVADAVQDALKSIRNELEEERQDVSLRSSETGLPDLRNMLMPRLLRVQAPPRFTVEVKGVSYERILSLAREILGTETTISGDVVMAGEKFILISRAADGGPWESTAQSVSADGLKQASRELAQKILMAQDPTLAAVALLKHGQIDEGLEELTRARNLKPNDPGSKLNLCVGFASSRRYDDAIECYEQVLNTSPDSPHDIKERLAQAYYLKGLRENAIRLYIELDKDGYRNALLGLGEAKDDTGDSKSAVATYDEFLANESQDRNKAIAHVKKGLALAHLHRHEEALAEYGEALKYAPGDVLILVHEGLERADEDIDFGIAQLKSVVDENRNSDSLPFARVQLGVLLEKKGDWQGAIKQYEMAAQTQSNYVEAHMKLAKALVHENQEMNAFYEYGQAAGLSASDLERGNSDIFANQWLANELRDLGKYPEAASRYRKAIQLKSDDSAAHCQLSLILNRQGQLIEAIREYGAALVPTKVQQLNDGGCLSIVDHLLDEAVASPGPGHAKAKVELANARLKTRNNDKEPALARVENAQPHGI
jgi:tetratricopeptide (TPR) repeat protein